jgi:tetratricopeptide (TPR) repeat protein
MAAVAVLALILGGSVEAVRLRRQRDEFLKKAAEHAAREELALEMERSFVEMAQFSQSLSERLAPRLNRFGLRVAGGRLAEIAEKQSGMVKQQNEDAAKQRGQAVLYHKSAAYHAALKRKYRDAASRPWRSIEPDPVPPDPADQTRYWTERGDYGRARTASEEAIEQDPTDESPLNDLAWLLATCPDAKLRDGKTAIELATRACEITGRIDAACLDTLAAAYAEAGDFPSAVRAQTEAIGKLSPGNSDAAGFRSRLRLYETGQPYREQPGRTR